MGSRGSLFIEFIEKCQKAKLCGALQYAIWDGKPQRGHTHAHADKHTQARSTQAHRFRGYLLRREGDMLECPSLDRHQKGAETANGVPYDAPTNQKQPKREGPAEVRRPMSTKILRGPCTGRYRLTEKTLRSESQNTRVCVYYFRTYYKAVCGGGGGQ